MTRRGLLAIAALALAGGCGDTQLDSSAIRSFDRPVDLAFGCYGKLRIVGANGVADPDDPIEYTAQPLSSCVFRHGAIAPGNAPPGQEDGAEKLSDSLRWLEIAVQPTSGTITTLNNAEGGEGATLTLGAFTIDDGDPLTPGHNPIAVGSLPLAIATDTAGCFAITANAGSCDLSTINLTRIALVSGEPAVRALPLTSLLPGGTEPQELLARPAAMVSVDLQSPIGVTCAPVPQGVVYVAYPDCHAVAAIRADTGAVVASIKFAADGTPTIDPTGELTCPRQCGERDVVADGARPVALDIVRDARGDFQRIAIGLDNRPVITVVDLDLTGRPRTVSTVELEGDIGVTDVAISNQIKMGGDNQGSTMGNNDLITGSTGVEAEFVYAVATDATVRVAEVLVANEECDTQVDPRYLFDERDPTRLVCLAVGQPGTPPRRAGARSPGIEVSGQGRPVAVTIVSANNGVAAHGTSIPDALAGHFAFIALSNGFTAVANVDDDNYPDTYLPTLPMGSVLALGLPHQLRDAIAARDQSATAATGRTCKPTPPVDTNGFVTGGPRADGVPTQNYSEDQVAKLKPFVLPSTHQTLCTGIDTTAAVSDLTFGALDAVRERTFPDWRTVVDEIWYVTWEGALSIDGNDLVVDGPAVRSGLVDIAGGGMRIADAGRPFCAAGVEPFDIVTLRGCDPALGDAECGAGETCYVHPDATVATGACLPGDRLEELAGACRDYLISQRRFSVFKSFAGQLLLHERRRELRTTPVSGCTSDDQCAALAVYDRRLIQGVHPKDELPLADDNQPFTYACEADPTRAPGPNRCVMTCTDDTQCDDGTLCRAGHCLEGIVPPPECAAGLQRYDLRGSDAFVVTGDRSGYLHPIIEDTTTGQCIKDTTASPLLIGRIPLSAPECEGEEPGDILPNPCSETVQQSELVPVYQAGTCTPASNDRLMTRSAPAIRFSNPALTFAVVDPTYPGDAMCLRDRGGGLGDIPSVFTGYNLRFRVASGFNIFVAGPRVVQPSNVVRAPDGAVWVIDSGDIDDTNAATPNLFGQVVRIDPRAPTSTEFIFR